MSVSSPRPKLPIVAVALLIALSLSMQAMLVSAQSADGRATFHGNPARTGEQPGPGPEGDPTLAWRFQTGDAVRSSPVMADGVIYVGSNDGSLYALDAETGEERWRFTTDGPISGSAAVAEGAVYLASGDGYAYAVDAETGEERWRFFAAELGVDPARLP
ncbi:MAG TPA: PQQ-binding-like beta-propeller repeat protein, partial [Thermomicrobiales bacterium]|nr:PQQ-binding-like beta-propeller repeat protein [Thermomicrobiales bacterium]